MNYFSLTLLAVVIILLLSSFRVLREYDRGVIFLLGRFYKVKGPGLILVIPFVQQMVKVDMRTLVMDVPGRDFHGQRVGAGQRGGVFPGGRCPESHYPGGKLL